MFAGKKTIRSAFALAAGLSMIIAAGACGNNASQQGSSSGTQGSAINVVSSINQWGSLAKEIGGSKVKVTSILSNPNVEAHEFEPKANDVAQFSKTDVTIYNGADYDPWAAKAAKGTKATVIDVAEEAGIKEGGNPHIWFMAKARETAAKKLAEAFKKARPSDSAYFDSQYNAWKKSEEKFTQAAAEAKKSIEGKKYAATESVASYLASDLGLEDSTPSGYANAAANESEPSANDIKEFTDILSQKKVSFLFVNDQETDSTTETITKAADSAKVPIVHITESMPSQYSTLSEWMIGITKQVTEAAR